MKEKIKNKIALLVLFLICTFQFAFFVNSNTISNELLAWGFRRGTQNQQPTFGGKLDSIINNYDGYYLGNKDSKNIYLTFDLGYEAGYTESILKTLKEENVKAAFFITGDYFNKNQELVKQMIQEGHIVGNHTVNHKSLPNLSDEEIKKEIMDLHIGVFEKFNYEMKFFRPPKGEFSERVLKIINELGYKTVLWSSAYDDWDRNKQDREEYGTKKIIDNLHNGCLLLLHGNSKDNEKILRNVIRIIKDSGYEFKSLDSFEK